MEMHIFYFTPFPDIGKHIPPISCPPHKIHIVTTKQLLEKMLKRSKMKWPRSNLIRINCCLFKHATAANHIAR